MKLDEFKKFFVSKEPRRKPRHIEEAIQIACVNWFRGRYEKYIAFAVGNGGSRNAIEAMNLKRSGVLAGVSDLILIADHTILFVEMKTEKGKQSERQKEFQQNVERLGFSYRICRSLEEFQITVKHWLQKD